MLFTIVFQSRRGLAVSFCGRLTLYQDILFLFTGNITYHRKRHSHDKTSLHRFNFSRMRMYIHSSRLRTLDCRWWVTCNEVKLQHDNRRTNRLQHYDCCRQLTIGRIYFIVVDLLSRLSIYFYIYACTQRVVISATVRRDIIRYTNYLMDKE